MSCHSLKLAASHWSRGFSCLTTPGGCNKQYSHPIGVRPCCFSIKYFPLPSSPCTVGSCDFPRSSGLPDWRWRSCRRSGGPGWDDCSVWAADWAVACLSGEHSPTSESPCLAIGISAQSDCYISGPLWKLNSQSCPPTNIATGATALSKC